MDRAYVDYRQFSRWTKAGIFFVTRLKENANYWDFEDWPVPKNSNVLKDQLIRLNPDHRWGSLPGRLTFGDSLGRAKPMRSPPAHQPDALWRQHHSRHLPRKVANRIVL